MFIEAGSPPPSPSGPRRVLITGCSSGIGRALASEMSRRNYHVIATARRVEALADLRVADRLPLDLASPTSIAEAITKAGRVDILINNAGLGIRGPVERVPVESVRELFETMFFGPLTLIQAVLPDMRQRGRGLIVNISSATGQIARPMFAFYPAVKVALEAMSEGLSHEVARFGIRVVVIQPGNIATNFRPSMRRLGQDGPYETIAAGIERWRAKAQRTELKMEATEFARRAVDVFETPDPRLRIPIGEDAMISLAQRRAQTDEDFREHVLREFLPGE